MTLSERELRIPVSDAVYGHLKRLVATGLFGFTVNEAAERLICEGILRAEIREAESLKAAMERQTKLSPGFMHRECRALGRTQRKGRKGR